MSESTPEVTVTPEATTTTPAEPAKAEPFDEQRAQEKIRKVNSEAENLRKRLKELEPLAKKAQELEDAQRSETEKAAKRAADAEQRATTAESELVRLRIALKHGIAEEDYDLLGTGSEDEVEGRAKRIAEKNAAVAAQAPSTTTPTARRPVESLRPGATPSEATQTDDAYPAHWLPASARTS